MKNILLPTDLTVQSLWPVHTIVKEATTEKVNICLVHMLSMPTSVYDLFFTKESKPYQQVPAHFTEAYQMLGNRYADAIGKISFRFVYGNSSRLLCNYIEGNDIDAAYLLDNYKYEKPLPQSINMSALLPKCKVPLRKLLLNTTAVSEYQILSALLDSSVADENMVTSENGKAQVSLY